MKLKSEKVNFKVTSMDLNAVYTESEGAKIKLEVQTDEDVTNDEYSIREIVFPITAEMKCVTLNFYESNYNQFIVVDEDDLVDQNIIMHSGFYEVIDSDLLRKQKNIYDPKNRLNLKHYLIVGNDSYIELIASDYSLS